MDITVVDGDPARRAQIRAMIECAGGTCAVFETAAQFDSRPRRSLLCFVADEARMVRSMAILLARFDVRPYLLAYRDAPGTHDVVEALKLGADDYLAWPFGPRNIRMRLQAARRQQAGLHEAEAGSEMTAGERPLARGPGTLTRGLRLVWNRRVGLGGRHG